MKAPQVGGLRRLLGCALWLAAAGARAGALEDAEAHIKAQRYAQALPLLAAELQRTPDSARVHLQLGMIALNHQRDVDAAITHLERAVALDATLSRSHLALAGAYGTKAAQAGFLGGLALVPKVKGALERAVALDPKSVDARLGLMQFYLMAPGIAGGSVDRAREEAAAILRLDPLRGQVAWAAIHERQKEPAKAEEAYRRALAAPGDAEPRGWVHDLLGTFYRRQQRPAEALAELQRSVALLPTQPWTHEHLGELYLEQRDWARAAESLEKALALSPRYAPALLLLARCRQEQGRKAEARTLYQRFLAERPSGKQADEARHSLRGL
jgi:tetratricopeptide (TPR) repeat protein